MLAAYKILLYQTPTRQFCLKYIETRLLLAGPWWQDMLRTTTCRHMRMGMWSSFFCSNNFENCPVSLSLYVRLSQGLTWAHFNSSASLVFSTVVILPLSFSLFFQLFCQATPSLSLVAKFQSVRWQSDSDKLPNLISVTAGPLAVHDAAVFVATSPALLSATRGLAYPVVITLLKLLLLILMMMQPVGQMKDQLPGTTPQASCCSYHHEFTTDF